MDRNSIIGLVLIMAIFIGFTLYNQPTQEQIEAAKKKQDSIAAIESEKQKIGNSVKVPVKSNAIVDSAKHSIPLWLDSNSIASPKTVVLENEVMKVEFSSLGASVKKVTLKKFEDYKNQPLVIADSGDHAFGLNFFENNKAINTELFNFSTTSGNIEVKANDSAYVSFRLSAGDGKYLEYVYKLKGNEYQLGFDVNFVHLNEIIEDRSNFVDIEWRLKQRQLEKSITNERNASTIYWQFADGESDYINEGKAEKQVIQNKLNWIAFKQQFFSAAFIAPGVIDKPITLETQFNDTSTTEVKQVSARFEIPYNHKPNEGFSAAFYFGPNHYKTLANYNLQDLVPLGWSFLGWINRWLVIPVFHFLEGLNLSYGIIILLLTIIVKILLFPLNYKSFMSGARMRVLKPEVDELNKKFEKKDPMEKQQAIMALYRKAGVNPMGGCLPMLLQLPITLAVFRFFPSSFELRHQSFLWAEDLSSYDSILQLPFNIWGYGDHVSLFAILMAITTVLYSMVNMQMQPAGDDMMAKQMKIMMYIMPIIFLGVMNSQPSGLCYYYTLGNLLTFGQQYLFKFLVDEKAIRAKIEENKKKPVAKSAFQKRLEDMAKQKGYKLPK